MSPLSIVLCILLFGGAINTAHGQATPPASDASSAHAAPQTNGTVELPSGPVSSNPEDQVDTEQQTAAVPSSPQQPEEIPATNQETSTSQQQQPVAPQEQREQQQIPEELQTEQQQPEQQNLEQKHPEQQQPESPQPESPQLESPQPEQKQHDQQQQQQQQVSEERQPEQKQTQQQTQQQQQTNEVVENIKPDVASLQEARQPAMINNTISQVETNEIGENKEILESSTKTNASSSNDVEDFNYSIESSCNLTSIIPDEIIQMAVSRILKTTASKKCGTFLDLKFKPMINQQIRGYVMEVSSMPVDLDVLTGALTTRVSCSNVEHLEPGKKVKLSMILSQDLGNKRLESKWRSYAEIQHDDIPVRLFGTSISRRGQTKTSSKCQKFRLELGHFHLDLLSFKTKLMFEIILVKLDDRSWSSKDSIGGGSILLKSIQVDELYLDDKINLDSIGGQKLNMASPTVQILHDENNHFRRNNWLLDLYGNWLKHEYKQQLRSLLADATFLERFNSCFVYQ